MDLEKELATLHNHLNLVDKMDTSDKKIDILKRAVEILLAAVQELRLESKK